MPLCETIYYCNVSLLILICSHSLFSFLYYKQRRIHVRALRLCTITNKLQ